MKVAFSPDCWVWTAATDRGYGYFGLRKGCIKLAHRLAYEALRGPIPEDLTIDHLCRNRSCVNPWHMEPVPRGVNTARGGNGIKTHCKRGHKFTLENTRIVPKGRDCRACHNERRRGYNANI
ncbi:MAG: HNH endonuclease [Actinomycetota bacterium]|nr:HNH endonuclease [Actinomycetota bacterium]